MTSIERSARILLAVHVAVYLAFGLVFIIAPSWAARSLGIELANTTALADLRAIYGGLPLGVGACLAAGLKDRRWLLPTVVLAGVCSLEVALARAYSWVMSGHPGTTIVVFMALELAGVWWALSVYRGLRRAEGRAQGTVRTELRTDHSPTAEIGGRDSRAISA
ncbi:MAG: DUF4345 domain-containing protein [Myxococcales bacterium]|nr:DUF4345 domain-containing protein [Myxococcales bacterium]MDD9970972.1 DUF4345 domain-containing protein [Myxococcales bacterium]